MPDMREKLVEILDESFERQYDKNLVITARNTANDLIANGVTIQRWIPVTDPPKTFGEYNVVVQNESGERHSDYADYDPYANRWKTGLMLYPGEKVTHWMPLPEPPKGE